MRRQEQLYKKGVLILCLLLAAFFRFYRLSEIPPAIYHDEATNGLDGLRVLRTGQMPIFFEANNGREPLFIYLQTAMMAVLGNRPFALRLVAAFTGIITVAEVYGLARTLFPRRPFRLPLLVMLTLALSYWHVHFSRLGLRAILMVPLITLAFWLFWRGWHKRRLWLFAWAGLALGLSLYTYLSARLVPVVILAVVGVAFLFYLIRLNGSKPPWFLLQGSLLMLAIGLLVFVPLGFYFLRHPEGFGLRAQQVSLVAASQQNGDSLALTFIEHLWQMGRMFVDRGHHYPVLSLPYRPVLDWITLVGFVVGLAVALRRWRQPAYPFLLIWIVVFLLPAILSNEAAHPLRSLGAVVPVAVLIGVGLEQLGSWLARHARPDWVWPIFVVVFVGVNGWNTGRDYFLRWAPMPETIQLFHAPQALAAQKMLTQAGPVFVSEELFEHDSTQFTLQSAIANISTQDDLTAMGSAVVIYPRHLCRLQEEMILFQRLSPDTAVYHLLVPESLDPIQWLIDSSPAVFHQDSFGRPIVGEDVVEGGMAAEVTLQPRIMGKNFGNEWCLLGVQVESPEQTAGTPFTLTIYWESLTDNQPIHQLEVKLEDSFGEILSTNLARQWTVENQEKNGSPHPGQIVASHYEIALPARAVLPGKFRFQIKLLPEDGAPNPLMNRLGLPYASPAYSDYVMLGAPPIAAQDIRHPLALTLGEPATARLIGYGIENQTIAAGDTAELTLYWQGVQPPARNYSVFVHLVGEDGTVISQHDGEPVDGRAPTSMWLPGELVGDSHPLVIPPSAEAGVYTLIVGMYDWQTGERLPALSQEGVALVNNQITIPGALVIADVQN